MSKEKKTNPGDGIQSLRSTSLFRVINFELYVKPNLVIMGLGLAAFTGCFAYIAYMRNKYSDLGYYPAIQQDGSENFVKKKSRWE